MPVVSDRRPAYAGKIVRVGRPGVITLTTDFGLHDSYVGAMKGAILSVAGDVVLVDITHESPPQDVESGACQLAAAAPYFPDSTIHIAVIDPGVGGTRRPIAVRTARATYIGPDNGIFAIALERDVALEIVHLTNAALWRQPVSPTFHGRDIFGPVAAHLVNGIAFGELGPIVQDIVQLALPAATIEDDGSVHGVIRVIDRFGNGITNIRIQDVATPDAADVWVGGQCHGPIRHSYVEVAANEPVALVSSSGHIELAVREGHAGDRLGFTRGTPVEVRLRQG